MKNLWTWLGVRTEPPGGGNRVVVMHTAGAVRYTRCKFLPGAVARSRRRAEPRPGPPWTPAKCRLRTCRKAPRRPPRPPRIAQAGYRQAHLAHFFLDTPPQNPFQAVQDSPGCQRTAAPAAADGQDRPRGHTLLTGEPVLPENTTGALDVDADGGRLFTGDATPLENVEDAEEEARPAPARDRSGYRPAGRIAPA